MSTPMLVGFVAIQVLYLAGLLVTIGFMRMPTNLVRPGVAPLPSILPKIILFYPVLRELEETMRTTLTGMARAPYQRGRLRVIAIPNSNDAHSVEALQRLAGEFSFLEVWPVPPTTDPSWDKVWDAWQDHPKVYWWHHGRRRHDKDLPPKKTRQLVWAMYQVAEGNEAALLSYIDADSVIPLDYWYTAARGAETFDVVQNTNITGNLLHTWASSFHGLDHIMWDATMYRHMTANGRHPFYVLGKGLFFRIQDLLDVGGFHPWLTIEDPEIGMRLWTNGKTLGVVESPLIEEVPSTWWQGVTQRKRWIAGFFQSLARPLREMGMTWWQRMRARINFVPSLSLTLNPVGTVVGIWAIVESTDGDAYALPWPAIVIGGVSIMLATGIMVLLIMRAWQTTANVLTRAERRRYLLRVNPLFVYCYWLFWNVSLAKGFAMFLTDGGLVWERTVKVDANHTLIRGDEPEQATAVDVGSQVGRRAG